MAKKGVHGKEGVGCAWQGGVCMARRGMHGKEGYAWQGGVCMAKRGVHGKGGMCDLHGKREAATAAGSTHPTGMHSCSH